MDGAYALDMLTGEIARLVDVDDELRAKGEPEFLCAACGHGITAAKFRNTVNGSHTHRFQNPDGLRFEIGCFAEAAGAAEHGEPTAEWTWFAGCRWRFACCRDCGTHLGWGYHSDDGGHFFGLILDRLAEPS